jgi:hypothetical protein
MKLLLLGLVAGLLLEVAVAFTFSINIPIIDVHLPQCAGLLVLLGVGGEIHFGARASRAQKELQRRTDVKLTEARERSVRILRSTFTTCWYRRVLPADTPKIIPNARS